VYKRGFAFTRTLLSGCQWVLRALVFPTLLVSGGPMLNGKFRGKDIGSGT